MRNLLSALLIAGSSCCFAETSSLVKGQVNLVGPTGVSINSGWSSWSVKLPQPMQVNPLQVMFWSNGGKCRVIPITSVSVKYINDVYWYNAMFREGSYQIEGKYQIDGVKLDFYLDGPPEMCVITVAGYRDISE